MNDKQQLAAMGEHLAEQQQPMCMAKRIEELEALLRESASVVCEFAPESSELIRRIDEALDGATVSHPVAPEDWKRVPVEPTTYQVLVGRNAKQDDDELCVAIYRSMLAAAPSPGDTK